MPQTDPVVTELTIDGSGAERGQAQYARAMDAAKAAMERAIAVNGRLIETQDRQVRVAGLAAAANDSLARSYGAANDNARSAAEGFKSTIVEVASLTNQLKFAALAAYAISPAFRAMVNPAITATVAAMGPAAASAAGAALRALTPLFAFLSRISVPILAIVAAWELLNSVIGKGSDLLERFGNAQRNLVAGVDQNLEKLTKFQDAGLSAGQVQYATELGARLNVAKKTISDFLEVQLDVTNAALKLQAAWVRIVELIASGVEKLGQMGTMDVPPWVKTVLRFVPLAGAAMAVNDAVNALSAPGPEPSREDALKAARARLAAGMGSQGNFAVRFGNAINDLQNPPKAAKEAADDVARLSKEFDRLEISMQRAAAVQEAEAKAVDVSVGEHARLRAEMRLQEAAQQDILKNGGNIEDYAERIKVLADRFGAAAMKAAELKLQSDIKFTGDTMFLSDTDRQIASILRRVYGSEWKNMMDGPIAGALRWNETLRTIVETTREIGSEITKSVVRALMDGRNVGEALSGTLKNLSARLADKAIEQLLSGDFAKAAVSAISAIATFVGSKLFGDDSAEKELKKAQEAWAGMKDQMDAFIRATDGFDLNPIVQQLIQLKQNADQLWIAAMKAGDTASAGRIAQSFIRQIDNKINEFAFPEQGVSDAVKQIHDLERGARQLSEELVDLNHSSVDTANAIAAGLAHQIAVIRRQFQDTLLADINVAEGKGFINEFRKLIEETSRFSAEAAITGVDPSLIARRFEVLAQKIVDGADLTGAAFNELLTLFPSLTGVIHESTSAIEKQAEAQRELQQQLDQAARSIADYVIGLSTGSESTLSPTAKFAAAQAAYNATLAQAQGNDLAALARITQDAENYRRAARDIFASGSQYQSIEAGIKAALLALPAVQTSADPVVQGLLAVQAAIEATTAAVGGTTSAVTSGTQGTTTAVGTNTQTTSQLLNTAVARLDTTITRFDTAITRLVEVVTNLGSVVQRLDFANGILQELRDLNNTATAHLQFLRDQFATPGAGAVITRTEPGGLSFSNVQGGANTIIQALLAIKANTYATAANTYALARTSAGNFPTFTGTFATGGVLAAGALGIFGEHHPEGPFFARAGGQPIPITPAMPGNDNSDMVAELRALRAEVARLQQMVAASGNQVARTIREVSEGEMEAGAENNKRLAFAIERSARDNRAA